MEHQSICERPCYNSKFNFAIDEKNCILNVMLILLKSAKILHFLCLFYITIVVIAAIKIEQALFLSEIIQLSAGGLHSIDVGGCFDRPSCFVGFIAKSGYADVFFTKLLVHLPLVMQQYHNWFKFIICLILVSINPRTTDAQ